MARSLVAPWVVLGSLRRGGRGQRRMIVRGAGFSAGLVSGTESDVDGWVSGIVNDVVVCEKSVLRT